MSEKDNGGPAFPMPMTMMTSNHIANEPEYGMTLRDYFAAKAMQASISYSGAFGVSYDQISTIAYDFADAMLKERAK